MIMQLHSQMKPITAAAAVQSSSKWKPCFQLTVKLSPVEAIGSFVLHTEFD